MDDSGVPILEPPEALLERALHLALNGIDLIACNPLLPLQLGISETPRLGERAIGGLALLELRVLIVHLGLGWMSIGSTVTPEILHTSGRGSSSPPSPSSMVTLHLHSSIPT